MSGENYHFSPDGCREKRSSGKFTGVMFGRDMIEVNGVMQTGLFGMKNGDLTFSIDAQTGDAFFGGTVLVRKDAKNYVTMNTRIRMIGD